jgi:predicted DNA-binding helix-hairpin-helix protein
LRSQIPKPIKVNVLRKWLHGQSRKQIAKEEGIGTGTVSSIIMEYKKNDTEFELLRQVAVNLKSQGYSRVFRTFS